MFDVEIYNVHIHLQEDVVAASPADCNVFFTHCNSHTLIATCTHHVLDYNMSHVDCDMSYADCNM